MKTISMTWVATVGLACGSGTAAPGGNVGAAPGSNLEAGISRPPPDENGVRVAGGETSDFGSSDTSEDDGCRFLETTTFSLAEALALELPIDPILSILDEPFEAPLHWGYRCDGDEPATAPPTRLALSAEIVNVYRTPRVPRSGAPTGTVCFRDHLGYRAVIDLATNDGRIAGRFYARMDPIVTNDDSVVVSAASDARNFTGSLMFPIDLQRPHFAAIITRLTLREEEGAFGSLDVEVNYTDDGRTDLQTPLRVGEDGWPERYGLGGFWPVGVGYDDDGLQVIPTADGGYEHPGFYLPELPLCPDVAPVAPVASLVSLDGYTGSAVAPTCEVEVSFFGQGKNISDGVTAPAYSAPEAMAQQKHENLEVTLTIDGVASVFNSRPGIVQTGVTGRWPVGTHFVLEARSNDPAQMPFAALTIDRSDGPGAWRTGYDQFDYCQPVDCVARVEDTVEGYCFQ